MRKILLGIALVFGFCSCEQVIDWPYTALDEERLVVEAILTDEYRQQEIRLHGLLDTLNGESNGISGAFVELTGNGETHLFWEAPSGLGQYISTNPMAIQPGIEYTLSIDWNQQKYQAGATAVEGYPMREFSFGSLEGTDSVFIQGSGVDYDDNEQAMYEFLIDWQHLVPGDSSRAKQLGYVFRSINIGQLFGPEKARLVFPRGSKVYVTKYALSDDFAEYLRSMVVETQWKGGVFEETSGNLPTNLSNGALGYFAACTLQRDTLIAE
jgi:hypothetical protein